MTREEEIAERNGRSLRRWQLRWVVPTAQPSAFRSQAEEWRAAVSLHWKRRRACLFLAENRYWRRGCVIDLVAYKLEGSDNGKR